MPDQAAGLRSLFARRRPSLLVVAGGDPCRAAVAAHFAREAASAGRATLLVDGGVGELASVCGVSCRFELAQVLTGDRALSDVIKVIAPNLLLLPSARALVRFGSLSSDEQGRLATAFTNGIAETFALAGSPDAQVELVVVNADRDQAGCALEAFGRDARIVIVASNASKSLRAAYTEIRGLVELGFENFEVIVPVNDAAPDAGNAYANLAKTAKRFLEIDLSDGGTVSVVPPPPRPAITFSSTRTSSAPTPPQQPSPASPVHAPSLSTSEVSHAAVH